MNIISCITAIGSSDQSGSIRRSRADNVRGHDNSCGCGIGGVDYITHGSTDSDIFTLFNRVGDNNSGIR